MTDTTDTAALREAYKGVEKQAHSMRGRPREYQVITGFCPVNVIEMQAQRIIELFDQLEAERQRADDAEGKLRSEVMKNLLTTDCLRKAHRKIAEMEADQVPFRYMAEWSSQYGGMEYDYSEVRSEMDEVAAEHDGSVIELFSVPQKPVGLRQIGSIDHDGGEFAEYFVEFTDSAQVGQAVYVIDSAIESAGGIVKDGE